jgi:hypothetical protein
MWKKLFYGASKKVANDVSKSVGNEMKKKMVSNKEMRLADQYRKETIEEYERDDDFKENLQIINERLSFLIASNNVCNKCLEFLVAPFDNLSVVNEVLNELEILTPQASEFVDDLEFENEFIQGKIIKTVTPILTINKLMSGDTEDSNGILSYFTLFLETEENDTEDFEKVFSSAISLIYSVKEDIENAFIEDRKSQVVKYYAYGVQDEIDFGKYELEDLA